MTGFATLARTELRLYLRDAVTPIFVFAMPLALLLVLGLPEDSRRPSEDFGGQVPIDTVLPSLAVALALAMLGGFVLPGYLTEYRSRGVLRRLSTTPASPAALLAAQVAINALMGLLALLSTLVVGRVALGMALPQNVPGLVLVLVLGVASLFAIGLLVAALARDPRTGWALGSLFFFPSLFFAGIWLPKGQMGTTLSRIGDFTPLSAFRESLEETWTGSAPEPLALAVMAAVAVAAGGVAIRAFRWE